MSWPWGFKVLSPGRAGLWGILLVLALTGAAGAAGVEGRLVRGRQPLEGGRVLAYGSIDFDEEPVASSGPSEEDGRYSLDLPPGRYNLVATAGDLWSYCGQNPVVVTPEERPWIGFDLTPWEKPVYSDLPEAEGPEGRVTGWIHRDGEGVEDVTVSLYFDDTDGFRGMGFLRSVPTGPEGRFRLDMVPEGRYYLLARRRGSGRDVGPVMKGDLISYYRYNPLRVENGKEVHVLVPLVAKRQDRDVYGTSSEGEATGFTGTVVDDAGRPVGGVHVFAYREPEMGHHKPAALSTITDGKGRYRIYLPGGGRFYVGARDGYGDNPSPGELFGHYEGTPDHSLTLEQGQFLDGVAITVKGVLVP